ncbi:unnamed protein product [Schistosoma rodhaini]|uniref:Uncharacterized protein n=2 Tax=Schistosoma rodhaini TaxID=6188 RepID=A0AA85GJE1_9TREM|nr:unnamed protein product [Schistosoma rodhaini]
MDKLSIFYSIKYIGKNNVIATYGDNDKVVFVHLAEHWKYGVMVVDVYISSTSGNTKVKSRQQYIINILSAAKIPFEVKDISSSETDKQFMFKALEENGKTVIAPQLFLGSEYLGLYIFLFGHKYWYKGTPDIYTPHKYYFICVKAVMLPGCSNRSRWFSQEPPT